MTFVAVLEAAAKVCSSDLFNVTFDRTVDEAAAVAFISHAIKETERLLGQGDIDALVQECFSDHGQIIHTMNV